MCDPLTLVFHDLLTIGLTDSTHLTQSNTHYMVLGTYGQELLVYKQTDNGTDWKLKWSRSLPAPVVGLRWVDMTGYGLRELVLVTSSVAGH